MTNIDNVIDWFIECCNNLDTNGMYIGDFVKCYREYCETNSLKLPSEVSYSCRMLFLGLHSRVYKGYKNVKLTEQQLYKLNSKLPSWLVDLFTTAIALSR